MTQQLAKFRPQYTNWAIYMKKGDIIVPEKNELGQPLVQ